MAKLPAVEVMYRAMVERDTSFDGAFFAGVKTTGIFCRPGCGAKKPRPENVEFFATASEALHAGYRPCKRCQPLAPALTPPAFVTKVLELAERHAGERLRAADLSAAGVDPVRAARWFRRNYGMTFQAYHRARRVGTALASIRAGASVARAAVRSGYQSDSGLRDAFAKLFGEPPARASSNGARALAARWLATPLGPLLAVAADGGICMLEFVDRRALPAQIATLRKRFTAVVAPGEHAHLDQLSAELARYFAGTLKEFRVPIAAPGTPFQESVWAELRKIRAGATRSYADVARAIGRPRAVRAVARANGDNRVAILIPCHRVVGSDGALTGYAGGLWRKEWLLAHERGEGVSGFTPA